MSVGMSQFPVFCKVFKKTILIFFVEAYCGPEKSIEGVNCNRLPKKRG